MAKTFYEKGKKYNCVVTGKPYFRTSVTINGKVHQVYGDGEKDAKRKIEELKSEADKGLNLDYRKSKVGDSLEFWLYNIKRVDKNLKTSSFAMYEGRYRLYMKGRSICRLAFQNFTKSNVQKYITELYESEGCTSSTITIVLKILKMFSKWAIDEGYIAKSPCNGIVVPGKYDKGKKEIEIFSEEERERLLAYMEESHYQYDTLIKLAFATGMRKGELLALKWEDIYDGAIHVSRSIADAVHIDKDGSRTRKTEVWEPKTVNAIRAIPLLKDTQTMLEQHKLSQMKYFMSKGYGRPEYVFTTLSGTLIAAANLHSSYSALLKRAGVPHRKFHAIRHTFATEAIRRGVNVKDLQMLMGHSDISMTYKYVQSDKDSIRSAIERMGAMM